MDISNVDINNKVNGLHREYRYMFVEVDRPG